MPVAAFAIALVLGTTLIARTIAPCIGTALAATAAARTTVAIPAMALITIAVAIPSMTLWPRIAAAFRA